jgi:hypothetical protein
MSTTPITLDFSKAQPINQAQGVTLDFSKAVPLSAKPLQQPVQVESSAMDKTLGALAPQPVPRTVGAGNTQGDLPGFEGSYASGDEDKGLFTSAAGVAAGAAIASPAVTKALATAAAAHPLAAKVIVKGLEGMGFGAGLKVGAKFLKLSDLLGGQ